MSYSHGCLGDFGSSEDVEEEEVEGLVAKSAEGSGDGLGIGFR